MVLEGLAQVMTAGIPLSPPVWSISLSSSVGFAPPHEAQAASSVTCFLEGWTLSPVGMDGALVPITQKVPARRDWGSQIPASAPSGRFVKIQITRPQPSVSDTVGLGGGWGGATEGLRGPGEVRVGKTSCKWAEQEPFGCQEAN